ncbi:MAG: lamin tail domain-containing protein [Kiritimatiellae bacterium]|nr:lamin tail domain-containing protein [Kiritimatiellia bacterium]
MAAFCLSACLLLQPAAAEIVINEIMYHPTNAVTDTEYIELYNPGPSPVDLSAYRFDNGVEYEFPAGTAIDSGRYLVVCEKTADFAAVYPGVTNILGNWSGSLDNGGERVTLSRLDGGLWVTADTVDYDDRGEWPDPPDGEGPSLELVHPGYDNAYGETWAASSGLGTPGAANSAYVAAPAPIVVDVAHDPPLPFGGAALTVSARVFGHDASPLTVMLRYRRDQLPAGAYAETAMLDDGVHEDGEDGDGIYAAIVPGLSTGSVLDFQIAVTNAGGPSAVAPAGAPAQTFLCWFGDDALYTGEFLTYHILLTQANRTDLETRDVTSNVLLDSTVILSDGRIFYNCGIRYRGSSSRLSYTGPKSYRIELPRGEKIDGFRELNLNACNPLLQHLGMGAFADNGLLAPRTRVCRLWLNNDLQTQSGEAWLDESKGGVYVQVDKIGQDFVERDYPGADWGNLYRNGDLVWHGTDPAAYASAGYVKETNVEANDYTDVRDMCAVLNDPPNSAFPAGLDAHVNVEEWITYFATHTVLNNNENGIANTSASDYYHYHDPTHGQCDLLPWDMDSVIDMSGSSWSCCTTNKSIWMQTVPVLAHFLRHPQIAPRYVARVVETLETVASVANMQKHFDSMGSALSPSFRSKLENSLAARSAFLMDEINFDLTAEAGGAATGKVAYTSSSTVSLSGLAPQPNIFSVRVNGSAATWNPYAGTWSMSGVALAAGMNRIRVEACDGDGFVRDALTFDLVSTASTTTRSGTLSGHTTWSPSLGVVRVSGDVTIPSGSTLTIAAGTTVMLDAGVSIRMMGGVLDVQGSEAANVCFLPWDGNTAWGQLHADGAAASMSIRYADVVGGQLFVTNSAPLTAEDSLLRDYEGNIVEGQGGGLVTIRRCRLHAFYETHLRDTPLLAEYSLFENYAGDAIDCADTGVQTHTIRRCTARHAHGGSADGIDFEPVRHARIEDCLIYDLDDRGLSVSGSTNIIISGCVIFGAFDGVGLKDGTFATVTNCTIVDCDRGLHLEEDLGGGPGHAAGHNLILWDNDAQTLLEDGATLALNYSDVLQPGTGLYPGTGNINAYPMFVDPALRDYRLHAYSPCAGSGMGGGDMGAARAVGAAPAAPGELALRNIGSTEIAVSWRDNSVVETAFEIERSLNGTDWVQVGAVGANVTNFFDETAANGETYAYRVRAVNPRGASFYSNADSIVSAYSAQTQALLDGLRITELMYHPRDGSENGDEYEFLELKNIGGVPLDLAGLYFDAGLDFTFPPGTTLGAGSFFVLVANPTAFAQRYPAVSIGGVYTNSALANSDERVRLEDADGNHLVSVHYYDTWCPTTDGEGYSLVLADPYADLDQPAAWRASTNLDGSPGADDPAPAYGVVLINELLSHTDPPLEDAIELVNTNPALSVAIGGWFLSDDDDDLRKYRIPNGTTIAAGGYKVFYEYQFNHDSNNPSCFALSSHGDTLYLSSADANTNLTAYRTQADFGAGANGVSFGRYLRSDGEADFVAMSNRTFGADSPADTNEFRTGTGLANACPKVGPVVINEIMYHPLEATDEFVELYNIGPGDAELYDPAHPSNTWRLGAATDYAFPSGTVIPAAGYVLVTRGSPALFREKFDVPAGVQILGPWDGKLDDAGESVKLYRPDTPDPDGYVPYIRVDRVKYNDRLPWPEAADGGGPSLERVAATQYGNDPTNWVAVSWGGTPGAANNVAALPMLAFAEAASVGAESDSPACVGVVLSAVPAGAVTVDYAVTGGTAVGGGTDYALAAGTLTFVAGQTNATLLITIVNDGLIEDHETIMLALSNAANARLGAPRDHTFTIADVDYTFVAYNDFSLVPGDLTYNITWYAPEQAGYLKDYSTGQDTEVYLTVNGGGAVHTDQGTGPNAGTDAYSVFDGKVTLKGLVSYGVPDMTVRLTGMDPQVSYELVLFGNRAVDSYTTRLTQTVISDVAGFVNDSTPGVTIGTASTAGDSSTICNGANTANGFVARYSSINPGTDGDMLITVQDGGSASPPQFYINAMMLRAGRGGSFALPAPTISPNGGAFAGSVSVSLACADSAAHIFYTTDGSTPGVDSQPYTQPFLLQQSAKVKARSVRIGYQDSEVSSAIFTRLLRALSFAQGASSGNESAVVVNIPVALSLSSGSEVRVDYAVNGGTAAPGVDFSLPAGCLTFLPGETTKSISLTVANDGALEPDETVEISLSSPVNARLGAIPVHTYTILDDDLYIAGVVRGDGALPLEGAAIAYSGPSAGSMVTGPDGSYFINADSGTYNMTVTAHGYIDHQEEIDVAGSPVTQDFQLLRANIYASPKSLTETLPEGTNSARTLLLVNAGTAACAWSIATGIAQGYVVSDSDSAGGPGYSWIEISGTGTRITGLGDDTNVGPFPIGFSFPFYGKSFSSFRFCSNGFISFSSTSTAYSNRSLPNTSAPENLLAACWDDLNPSSSGSAYYQLIDPDTLVVEFVDFSFYSYRTRRATFELILKSDGTIIYQYKRIDIADGCTVGIQNQARNDGVQVAYDQSYLQPSMAVRFAPGGWLTLEPETGTTGAGRITPVTVTFDAAGLAAGAFQTTLALSTDDPATPSIQIPVTLNVTPADDLWFVAYNDMAWFSGQINDNITTYTITNGYASGVNSGQLVDYRTGDPVGVSVLIQGGSGVSETQGLHPASGTDAFNVFDGQVNCNGTVSYGAENLTLAFSGLDPALEYELVLYADRNNSSYVAGSARNHYGTLLGADDFVNASSLGTTVTTDTAPNDTTVYNAGYNNPYGYVARFTQVKPGLDGQILFRVRQDGGAGYYTYMNAFMLRAFYQAPKPTTKLATGASWRYRRGTAEASSPTYAWRDVAFDDSGWSVGPAPFGHGTGPFGTTLDMRYNYPSFVLRRTFVVNKPALVSEARLRIAYDDGFIAWVNGQEIARVNVAGLPGGFMPYHTTAAYQLVGAAEWFATLAGAELPEFVPGTNVLAVQVFNIAVDNSDSLFDAELAVVEGSRLPASKDGDADGMPDAWEIGWFGNTNQSTEGDTDLDGVSNLDEFIMGTNPDDGTSIFGVELSCSQAPQLVVTFATLAADGTGYNGYERYYCLDGRPEMNSGQLWRGISGYSRILGTGQTVTYNVPTNSVDRYWRVRVWLE